MWFGTTETHIGVHRTACRITKNARDACGVTRRVCWQNFFSLLVLALTYLYNIVIYKEIIRI